MEDFYLSWLKDRYTIRLVARDRVLIESRSVFDLYLFHMYVSKNFLTSDSSLGNGVASSLSLARQLSGIECSK